MTTTPTRLLAHRLPLLLAALLLSGCSTVYYRTLESVGIAKREVLVDRVEGAREAQEAAKTQFKSALEQFLAVTQVDGGELADQYEKLTQELERSEDRAQAVRARLAAVEDVAAALFREWAKELDDYTNPTLREESARQLGDTRRRYDGLVLLMRRAADRMDPVLATFRDQVLFLKHNLNARALASLDATASSLSAEITTLVADMEKSIREADAFIATLRP